MTSEASNTQSQSQTQTISISVASAGNPDLEQRIFSRVHSAGRQLSRISSVLEVLIELSEANTRLGAGSDGRRAIDEFEQLQRDIEREKLGLADPERLYTDLEALKQKDPAAFSTLRDRLSVLLQSP